jgi:hypothetical protein
MSYGYYVLKLIVFFVSVLLVIVHLQNLRTQNTYMKIIQKVFYVTLNHMKMTKNEK